MATSAGRSAVREANTARRGPLESWVCPSWAKWISGYVVTAVVPHGVDLGPRSLVTRYGWDALAGIGSPAERPTGRLFISGAATSAVPLRGDRPTTVRRRSA